MKSAKKKPIPATAKKVIQKKKTASSTKPVAKASKPAMKQPATKKSAGKKRTTSVTTKPAAPKRTSARKVEKPKVAAANKKVGKPTAKPSAKKGIKKPAAKALPKKFPAKKQTVKAATVPAAEKKIPTSKIKPVAAKPKAKAVVAKKAPKPIAKPSATKTTRKAIPKKPAVKKAVKPAAVPAAAKKKPETKTKSLTAKPKAKTAATTKPPLKQTTRVTTAAKKKAPAKRTSARKPAKQLPDIPAILLEGDAPRYSAKSGPGNRYDLGSSPVSVSISDDDLVLPEAYGTRRLHLVARDPQWLYAHWDLTNEQLLTYNQLSQSGNLTLQIFEDEVAGSPKSEIEVHPESRSWFAHVGKGGENYVAVLGFRDKLGEWKEIAVSSAAATPPDSLSDDLQAEFTSIPVTVSFKELIRVVREYAAQEPKLAKALKIIQDANVPEMQSLSIPMPPPSSRPPRWTEAQQQALADAVTMDEVRRVWIGSQEVLELIKGHRGISSESAIPAGGISSMSSISSPHGGEESGGERGFWFNVNAELIIYGATEPDASVTIGERQIKLREDGTFSYRFALPDGQYGLPIAATSSDKVETRNADLQFARSTEYRGDVGKHPQDPKLKKPSTDNVS